MAKVKGNKKENPSSTIESSENLNVKVDLIHFDLKTKVVLSIFLVGFIICVIMKLNGSSQGMWNQILPSEQVSKKTGILFGSSKSIRSDEWLGQVPFHVAQYYNNFHYQNETLGPLNTPLVWNMPNRFWVNVLKPSYWGCFFLDLEGEFSYFWCFRIFFPMAAYFLFFMLVTKNDFLLSLFGAFWGFLTSCNQWWSLYLGEMTGYLLMSFVALTYVLFSKNTKQIILFGFILLLVSYSFIINFYPAWQVPLIYFFIAAFGGYILDNKDLWKNIQTALTLRLITLAGLALLLGGALWIMYLHLKETSEIMMATKYPGRRFSTGGGYDLNLIFTAYFSNYISDGKLPATWGNISEISKYLMFFPLPIYLVARNLVSKKTFDFTILFLSVLILIDLFYMLVGFKDIVSMVTLFKFTPSDRMTTPFGFVNLILVIVFLSRVKLYFQNEKLWLVLSHIGAIVLVVAIIMFGTNGYAQNYFKNEKFLIPLLFATVCFVLLLLSNFKWAKIGFMVLVTLFLVPNFVSINPINKGLPAFTKHPFALQLKEMQKQEPNSKWAVFGNFIIPCYLKSFNLKVVNGLQTMPDFNTLKILDPGMKNDSVYNRYGYMTFAPFIDGKDSVVFQLAQQDLYTIGLDPCSPKLRQLGVKYLIFTYQPQPAELRCLKPVPSSYLNIYTYNDN